MSRHQLRRPSLPLVRVRVLVLDNYDSFTYNLVQFLGELGSEIEVVRNDHATVDDLLIRGYDRVIVSPGPCTPDEAGISLEAVRRFPMASVPTLGVCLGHQALVQAWGGKVVRHQPVHGRTTKIDHDGKTIFRGLREPLEVGRYHSLVAHPTLPDVLETQRGRRRGRDGRPPPRAAGRGHPVPSRVRAHRTGPRAAQQLPAAHAMSAAPDLMTRSIDALASGEDLSLEDAAAVLSEIMAGNASEIQIAAFLIALRTKGETVDELAGLARTMRAHAVRVQPSSEDLLDTAGTGGGRRTFNVSTTAALIAAGAGCSVAKHGNRSATGLSGSADVLEALGARIDLSPDDVARCIDEVGFGFMFAPAHHQATRYVIPVRRELAVRTIFNFLGPLTNPAGATRQLVGVSDPALSGDDGRRARAAGDPACTAGQRRGRRRRAQHLGAHDRGRGCRRRASQVHGVPRGRGSPARRARGRARGRPTAERRYGA